MLTGTPCSGPSLSPLATASSACLASRRASSAITTRKQLSLGWAWSIAFRTVST